MLSLKTIDRESLPYLGGGLYGKVSAIGPTLVYKIAYLDGTCDFIEWCFLRMRKYGPDHPEMEGLPRVYDFRRLPDFNWECVMERYDMTARERGEREYGADYGSFWDRPGINTDHNGVGALEFAEAMARKLSSVFGEGWANDLHNSNVMWSEKRGGWILTDPSSSSSSGTAPTKQPKFTQSPAKRDRKTALWKRGPLRNLYHMQAH